MNTVKKIVFPLFSIFLLYRSVELLKQVMATESNAYNNQEILIIAVLLVLFITGIFAFPGFAYPTNRVLPASYYRIKKPASLKQFYRLLGVKYFRVFLLVFFWGYKKNAQKYFDGTRSGLQNFVYQSKQSEFGHLGAFVSVLLVSLIVLVFGHLLLFILLTFLNIIANFYPVILQRYHRIRIDRIIKY